MKKIIVSLIGLVLLLAAIFFALFFVIQAPVAQHITWGVNFSENQAKSLQLDWKATYLALLEDLQVKHIKLLVQWDAIEPTKDNFSFDDTDWEVSEAQAHQASLIYVVGMKTGRWPECHVPGWANGMSKQDQQAAVLQYVTATVERYKSNSAIVAWQAENEPLFVFGECPWYDSDFLKTEVQTIHALDPTRQVIVSDSGEQSLWLKAATIGDSVGVTMYRRAWFGWGDYGFYFDFPLPPLVYWLKAQLVDVLFGKKVIGVELQAEPWTHLFIGQASLQEQEKTMNPQQFQKNILYAKQTGLDEFYLWGSEWWYWMKEVQHKPEIWNEARSLFTNAN